MSYPTPSRFHRCELCGIDPVAGQDVLCQPCREMVARVATFAMGCSVEDPSSPTVSETFVSERTAKANEILAARGVLP
jgi:hypothetical protein